jgi:hypothetical protein
MRNSRHEKSGQRAGDERVDGASVAFIVLFVAIQMAVADSEEFSTPYLSLDYPH